MRRNPDNRYHFVLDGPAIKVFEYKIKGLISDEKDDFFRLIADSDLVLTGTSWASDLEKKAIKLSKEQDIKVVSFLDHWGNYLERFQFNSELMLPDEIWVGDKYALHHAEEVFQNIPIHLVENPYLMDIRDEINLHSEKQVAKDGYCHILYVCEPVAVHAHKETGREDAFGYTEFQAMDLFVSHLHNLAKLSGEIQVRIRSHPSELPDKYASYTENELGRLEITLSHGNTLIEDCAWSDLVVGMNSMALVVALEANKKVYCCIPGSSKPIGLPHKGIHNFLDLKKI